MKSSTTPHDTVQLSTVIMQRVFPPAICIWFPLTGITAPAGKITNTEIPWHS